MEKIGSPSFSFEIKLPAFQTRNPSRGRRTLNLTVIMVVPGREKGMGADIQHFLLAYSICLRSLYWEPWQSCRAFFLLIGTSKSFPLQTGTVLSGNENSCITIYS